MVSRIIAFAISFRSIYDILPTLNFIEFGYNRLYVESSLGTSDSM